MPTFKESEVSWNGKHFNFQPGVYQRLKALFWDKDVDESILKAERWAQFNAPKKRWMKFLCNWLNRAPKKMNFEERKKLNENPGAHRKGDNGQPQPANFQKVIDGLRSK